MSIAVVNAIVKEEKVVGLFKCTQCGSSFPRKELHLQDVLVIVNPKPLCTQRGNRFFGEPMEFKNLFVLSKCPSCGFHNQDKEDIITIGCKLDFSTREAK